MDKISKKDMLELVASLPDGDSKRGLIALLIERGEVTEEEVARTMVEDVERNIEKYHEVLRNDKALQFLWERFRDHPVYLARALVRIRPDIFYAYGFAFRLILKLRANLGPVVLPPLRSGESEAPAVFMERLPEQIQSDIIELDRECRFREYLYAFSRDTKIGFELLDDDIQKAKKTKNDYTQKILQSVKDYCRKLLDMEFPGFVKTLNASPFPAFHVRWWIDKIKNTPRILNIGDTGTQKTAFSVLAASYYSCQKTLVLCTANARLHWKREIEAYLPGAKVFLLTQARDVLNASKSKAEFNIVAYSTLIQENVAALFSKIPFDHLIWDECQYGKNVTGSSASQRATTCIGLIKKLNLKRLTALSATPWENHPIELGAIASALRPDIFPHPEIFRRGRPEDPRFLREFFAANIIEVEMREIKDLPPITPKPWEDLFGAELISPNPLHRTLYNFVRESEDNLQASQKVERLIRTVIQPHKIKELYQWPEELGDAFESWELSTKLEWIKKKLEAAIKAGAKCVVGTGIYTEGITRETNGNGDDVWAAGLLKKWFGEDAVLIIDGRVSQRIDKSGTSKRDQLIKRWRQDASARILVVSMRACPDSINLTVPKLEGVNKLFITTLSYPWIPWKQFLGRFPREGQGVPVEYRVPVLRGTIDESLLLLVQRKWEVQQLFRAQVPLTEEEISYLDKRVNFRQLAEESRSDLQKVNIICDLVKGQGEQEAKKRLSQAFGTSSNAEIFAKSFLATQQFSSSGQITRFMRTIIGRFLDEGLAKPETILDAGCGPLTLERSLEKPVFGIDMIPFNIELGSRNSTQAGKNASVGFLSTLPKEWKGKFDLIVASLVLDWTSLKVKKGKIPERMAILIELVRVTHPFGRIWFTFTKESMTSELLLKWIEALRIQGFSIVSELTGLVSSIDGGKKPFHFWSLCFSPNGQPFVFLPKQNTAFSFFFELERIKKVRGSNGREYKPIEHEKVIHREFELTAISGHRLQSKEVADAVADCAIERLVKTKDLRGWKFHKAPNLSWRVLEKLYEMGLLEKMTGG